MNYQIEVCIDNLESLHQAIKGGATRIELCSSLDLGGLTPSLGLMKMAVKITDIPIYAMIRPRQADFLYDQDDIEAMMLDIDAAADAGLKGIVFGLLNENGDIDVPLAQKIVERAKIQGLGVTFHRAIDQCSDYRLAVEQTIKLGCDRVLTSGLSINAEQGIEVLADMVKLSNNRISIMAGAGVTGDNVAKIVVETGVKEVHLSGKSSRASRMKTVQTGAKMAIGEYSDFIIPVTRAENIHKVVTALRNLD